MTALHKLVEKLIADAPEEQQGAIECQITFKTGQTTAGALRHHDIEGVYVLTHIGVAPKVDGTGRPSGRPLPFKAEVYFELDTVLRVEVVTPLENSDLHVPDSRIITPGIRGA